MKGISNTGGSGSSGHVIITGTSAVLEDREYLQFGSTYDPVVIEDDPTNNKTIVHGQLFICDSESDWNTLSDADFKAKYGADRDQAGVYWYLPWANSIAYQTDLTPVGTVLSLAVDTTNTTIFPADLIEFPNKDYVICRGATVKITDYPLLYQYFEDEYGDGNYFGTAQTAEGYFVLPNWSADFPTNGVLVIKARVTSDVITFAEVDDEAVTAENVWSAEKTKEEIDALNSELTDYKTLVTGTVTPTTNSNYTLATTPRSVFYQGGIGILDIQIACTTPDATNWITVGQIDKAAKKPEYVEFPSGSSASAVPVQVRIFNNLIQVSAGTAGASVYRGTVIFFV